MLLYYIVYFLLILFAFLSLHAGTKKRNIFLIISIVVVVSFQSFRWRTVTDWSNYYDIFISSEGMEAKSLFEISYFYLNKFISSLTGSYTIFLFVENIIIIACSLTYAKMMNVNMLIMIVLASFSSTVFPVRFNLAASILLLSYVYIYRRKIIPYLFLVILASTIHFSAIFFLPFYFVSQKMYTLTFYILSYTAVVVVSNLFQIVLADNINAVSAILYTLSGDGFQDKVDAYVGGTPVDYLNRNWIDYSLSFLSGGVIIIFCYRIVKLNLSSERRYVVLYNLMIVGILFNRLFTYALPYLSRIGTYATGGLSVILTIWLSSRSKKNKFICFIILCLYYFLMFHRTINGQYNDLYIPYYSIFSSQERSYVY